MGEICGLSLTFPTRGSIIDDWRISSLELICNFELDILDWLKVNIFLLNLIWTYETVLASVSTHNWIVEILGIRLNWTEQINLWHIFYSGSLHEQLFIIFTNWLYYYVVGLCKNKYFYLLLHKRDQKEKKFQAMLSRYYLKYNWDQVIQTH